MAVHKAIEVEALDLFWQGDVGTYCEKCDWEVLVTGELGESLWEGHMALVHSDLLPVLVIHLLG